MVFVDGYEGAAGCAEDSESRHQYVLRFRMRQLWVPEKLFMFDQERIVGAFRMYLAWVHAIAPSIAGCRRVTLL